MSANGAFDQTLFRDAIKASIFAVAGCGCEKKGQILGRLCRIKAFFKATQQCLWRADAYKARNTDCVAVFNDGHCIA